MRVLRLLFILAGLATAGFFSIRDAAVRSSLEDGRVDVAATAWSSHPAVRIARGMALIGRAVRHGRSVGDSLTGPIIEAGRSAPLAIAPFLVEGVKLQNANSDARAELLFKAAQERDPRDPAPHLLLSAHYAKTGRGGLSLVEIGKVVHLVPGSAEQIAPQVASAVSKAGGETMIRSLVAESPELRANIVLALATDAANLDFILGLTPPDTSTEWQFVMVRSLISAGLYQRAYELWARANHRQPKTRSLLMDADGKANLPPPFGWTLMAGSQGFAERTERGGFHFVSFGRQTVTLASQTLLLPAGEFRLSFHWRPSEGNASGFTWQVTCLPSGRKIASIPFGRPGAGATQGRFSVAADCTAERMDLVTALADVPRTVDFTLPEIQLSSLK